MPGTRVRAPVQTLDFVATCLDYAGIDPPEGVLDGVSLRRILQGEPAPENRPVFSATTVGWPMARIGRMKLIRGTDLAEALFDLDRDPGETADVHGDPRYEHELFALRVALDEALRRPVPAILERVPPEPVHPGAAPAR